MTRQYLFTNNPELRDVPDEKLYDMRLIVDTHIHTYTYKHKHTHYTRHIIYAHIQSLHCSISTGLRRAAFTHIYTLALSLSPLFIILICVCVCVCVCVCDADNSSSHLWTHQKSQDLGKHFVAISIPIPMALLYYLHVLPFHFILIMNPLGRKVPLSAIVRVCIARVLYESHHSSYGPSRIRAMPPPLRLEALCVLSSP